MSSDSLAIILFSYLDELHADYRHRLSLQYKREHSEWKPVDEVGLEE